MGSNNKWRMVIVVLVLFSGCGPSVTFEHSLVDPNKAPKCPDLFGVYPFGNDEEGRELYLSVSSAEPEYPKGFLRVQGYASSLDGRIEVTEFSRLAFCARRGNDYFFHWPLGKNLAAADDGQYFQDNWSVADTVGYEIDAWTMNDDGKLSKWNFLDGEYLAEQIEAGHLRGTVVYDEQKPQRGVVNDIQSVHVTATRDELWRFLDFVKKHKFRQNLEGGLEGLQKLQLSENAKH